MKKVAVLGAGAMGHGIAQVALAAGYEVNLRDIKQEFVDNGVTNITKGLSKLMEKGKLTQAQADEIINRLHTFTSLEAAVKDADIILEAIPEVLDLKISTFREVDQYAKPEAIIASNSSSMSITAMGNATARADRVFGLHFFNPVPVMKLVEVIKTKDTSDETVAAAVVFGQSLGKEVVVALKDTPGFVANRIACPTAAYLAVMLDEEHLSPEEIDATARKAGAPMGGCELCDFVGLDVHVNAQNYYAHTLHPDYAPSKIISDMVANGHLGMKTGKGFYDWSNGRPQIDLSKAGTRFDPELIVLLQANEACKLVDEGVCTFEDADRAMKFGFNASIGPIEAIQNLEPQFLAQKLNSLADMYSKEIFRPASSLARGDFRK